MEFQRVIIAVAVFAIFAVGAFTAFQVADISQKNAPANDQNVTNESIPQEYDAYQFVDKALLEYTAGFGANVTVYNNSSVELTEGEDYQWNETDGTIKFENTAATNESNPANISYTYYRNTQSVREIGGILGPMVDAVGKLPLFAAGLSLSVLLIVMGGFIAKRIGGNDLPARNR